MTDFDQDLNLREVMTFIREMGAVSIKETKEHFGVNSRSVRHAFAKLTLKDKIWLVPYRRAIYATEDTGKKGNPSIKALRKVWGEGHWDSKPGHGPKPKSKVERTVARTEYPKEGYETDFADPEEDWVPNE